ncbi:MAG TPA: response regulator transcription factor [Myxococcaceae bacterium]|nr:response regulator transcription factor [Myxococcaceae bacterium]
MARILVVEDEADLATLLVYNLQQSGHQTDFSTTGAGAIAKANSFKPELILLDLMLPDISGLEVIRNLRNSPQHHRTAVMMLTAKTAESDRVQGFELGADDYVVKPFSVREVLLRVDAILRRLVDGPKGDVLLTAANISVDTARHEVTVEGASVTLTPLEFRLLTILLERPGRIQTREALLSDVWGIQAEIETRTVDTHIKRLRQKLGGSGDFIETIRGVGYRFVDLSGGARS